MKLVVHTDGGARGNPGPAAVGVVIDGVASFGKRIGVATNNVAEYRAVLEALVYIRDEAPKGRGVEGMEVQFFLDSLLVVNQLNGLYKVKEPTLRELLMKVRELEQEVGGVVTYTHVPREQNKEADRLVNEALDAA